MLPVLTPLAPPAELAQRFTEHLASVVFAYGAPHALIEHELTAMLEFQYAKTANRSLLYKKAISPDRELRRLIEAEWTITAANDKQY